MKPLQLEDYAHDIDLFEPFNPTASYTDTSVVEKEAIVDELLALLKPVINQFGPIQTDIYTEKRRLLHAALNLLEPRSLNRHAVTLLGRLLQTELYERTITDAMTIYRKAKLEINGTQISLWQGDITTLKIDAIVNAANNRLLGCFQPLHGCIDNAIHSRAGVQLRDDFDTIMQKQKMPEPTGITKVTRAYHLPSRFVLHTVGPIVRGRLTAQHVADLQSAYRSCLEMCATIDEIKSVAFCCISTGEFGYPQVEAAETATQTVFDWLEQNRGKLDHIVFNVFTDRDRSIYHALFNTKQEIRDDE